MTVLDHTVMEHNVLVSLQIYNNISFSGLGALLDLTPRAMNTMACKMIEQGHLKGHINQVDKLIWFEAPWEEDDVQGKAGGLGNVNQDMEDTGSLFTQGRGRWPMVCKPEGCPCLHPKGHFIWPSRCWPTAQQVRCYAIWDSQGHCCSHRSGFALSTCHHGRGSQPRWYHWSIWALPIHSSF